MNKIKLTKNQVSRVFGSSPCAALGYVPVGPKIKQSDGTFKIACFSPEHPTTGGTLMEDN